APESGAGSANRARPRPARETHGASIPETLPYRPALRGCANTSFPQTSRDGPEEQATLRREPCGCLAVACGATRDDRGILDVIFARQLAPERELIVRLTRIVVHVARLPAHAENLVARPKVPLRLTVTLETPFHEQRRRLIGERHFIDPPVAGDTANAFVDVDAVIEINKAGRVIDFLPENRLVATVTTPHR